MKKFTKTWKRNRQGQCKDLARADYDNKNENI